MITGFRDKWLHAFFAHDTHHKKIPPSIRDRLFRKLQIIDDATCDQDSRSPSSNHFEQLAGQPAGQIFHQGEQKMAVHFFL